MTHFNRVVECIITTCIGDPSMTAQDRARVVELWIQVAKECHGLRNLSSLHTIFWALEGPSIQRLKETWRQVSRWVGLSPCEHHLGGPDTPHRAGIALQSVGTSWETANPGDRV
ncbi:ral guanine nucleotide dissociation stimulator-like [Diceros bicornis minor]|uniref:ral guanine nucleotide dissociation stimulator-like n=1 Tax=Diceros bicornis minor TaxID=77932 RepID=UPI0026EC3174|nr:ral guanine nucleotide dissociation stimulator-like [Diceros bicornis minor]XP_058382007.1 ral guanine nucleotide dissociation stimulator-like [Diceros bicornis minor]XP_058393225.1 ral guanine nucleotide dissociation stimulator-like [Diceros bicornis minor]XP_058393261.1 ral guanine nucleotide dissociation stimulator-like [Diceros bicornis minor]XP_058393481.1 ral guanine nucleotide dissociation stimulator-like [Diceros bicornis minor]XP_058393487.1 ral guanine nucleotide dissociation stim